MKLSLQFVADIVARIVKDQPVRGVKIAVGDFNGNGQPDVGIEIHVRGLKQPLAFGPIDAPVGDVLSLVEPLIKSLG